MVVPVSRLTILSRPAVLTVLSVEFSTVVDDAGRTTTVVQSDDEIVAVCCDPAFTIVIVGYAV
jgi:hypothetical protein